jgi:NAD(P)-dependent dehydrogenase (short-subunit alcohol dehydrogenase family)
MEDKMSRLEGKVILVAGGGGLGNGLARRYARDGAHVVLGHNHLDAAQAVAKEIEGEGGSALAVHLDGTEEASIVAAVALAKDRFGGLDGLHANFAAMSQARADTNVLDIPLAVLEATMQVNLTGYLLCTRHALPPLLERGGGAIVYTSSIGAHMGEPAQLAYAMSKAAGHALMRHVAATYGPQGVRANVITPGMIRHEKWDSFPDDIADRLQGMAIARAAIKSRIANPNDIASLGALLMSDDGAYITGQVIRVDGGTTMGL